MGLDPPNRGRFRLTALATKLRLVSRDGGLLAGPPMRTPPPKLITDWNCRAVGAPAGRGGNWLPMAGARPSDPERVLRALDRGTPRKELKLTVAEDCRSSKGSLGKDWPSKFADRTETNPINRKSGKIFMATVACKSAEGETAITGPA